MSDWLRLNPCQAAHLGMAGALLSFQSCLWAHVNECYRLQVGVMGQGRDITLQTEGIAVWLLPCQAMPWSQLCLCNGVTESLSRRADRHHGWLVVPALDLPLIPLLTYPPSC